MFCMTCSMLHKMIKIRLIIQMILFFISKILINAMHIDYSHYFIIPDIKLEYDSS